MGYRYPDVFVNCVPLAGDATVAEPTMVFEVLSSSTSVTDRIVKTLEYGATPSIRRYVILEQTRQAATVFSRDMGEWAGIVIDGDTDLVLPEIDVTIPLAELYQGVELPAEDDRETRD